MRECEYYRELMSRLLDEGLTAEEETALREHIRLCPDCRETFAAFTGMTASLREDQAEPPRDLARGVMERIAYETERSARPGRRETARANRSRRVPSPWVRFGAAACLVLIAVGGAVLLRAGREGPPAADMETASAQARDAVLEEDPESVPMTISLPDEDAAPPSPTPEPLPVYDAARARVGSIAPENIPAFEALITDEGWAEGEYEYMVKVEYRQKTYAFATDDSGSLVWWEEPSTQPLLSPGTFAQLHALIAMDPPALPQ